VLVFAKPHTATKALNYLTYYLMHFFTFFGGVKVRISGQKDALKEKGLFVISSHVSYLDAVILGTLLPGSFSTKSEAKKIPFFGQVVSVGNSIFIDRKRKSDILHYVTIMADRLKNGINVFNFPEGHATDGTQLLSFFPSFFNAPLMTRSVILPVTIDYQKANGSADYDRDKIYWYDGKISLLRHLWNFLKFKNVDVTVTIHEKIMPGEHKADARGRKRVSDLCMKRLSEYTNLPINFIHPLTDRNPSFDLAPGLKQKESSLN
jgi:1-acyl-sn-glycerol-3-phosphate acyltransferase